MVVLQVLRHGREVEGSLKPVVLSQFLHLIFKIFLLLILTLSYLLRPLAVLLLLFLPLLPSLVVLCQSSRLMEANDHKTHDSHKDILFHVFWDVILKGLFLHIDQMVKLFSCLPVASVFDVFSEVVDNRLEMH